MRCFVSHESLLAQNLTATRLACLIRSTNCAPAPQFAGRYFGKRRTPMTSRGCSLDAFLFFLNCQADLSRFREFGHCLLSYSCQHGAEGGLMWRAGNEEVNWIFLGSKTAIGRRYRKPAGWFFITGNSRAVCVFCDLQWKNPTVIMTEAFPWLLPGDRSTDLQADKLVGTAGCWVTSNDN